MGKEFWYILGTYLHAYIILFLQFVSLFTQLWIISFLAFLIKIMIIIIITISRHVSFLLVFYGIPILVGYFMPNPIYIYIYDLLMKSSLVTTFNRARAHMFAHS